jgi:hypothetical protein
VTDVEPDHDDDQGDAPDTFDDRLADIGRLIDTLGDETDPHRRQLHRAVIVKLIALLGLSALDHIAAALDRLDAVRD